MRPILPGSCFFAALLYVFALPIYALETCPEQLQPKVAQYESDGYRPLLLDEKKDMAEGRYLLGLEKSEYWRPGYRVDDCRKRQSRVDLEDRGYRPLNYGAQGQRQRPVLSGGDTLGYPMRRRYRRQYHYHPSGGLYCPDAQGNVWHGR